MKGKKFFAGMLVYASITSLLQDLVYKTGEAYAEFVRNSWIDRSITIPLAIIGIIISFVLTREEK